MILNQIVGAAAAMGAEAGLKALLNLVPRPDKLTILPMKQFTPVPLPAALPYVAMINPETWDETEEVQYATIQAFGDPSIQLNYRGTGGSTLQFKLVIDGTGAAGDKREVADDIEKLRSITGWYEEDHSNYRLIIVWGKRLFMGVMTSLTVNYTLFKPDGRPLRANVTLAFKKSAPQDLGLLQFARQSADLTHRRTVNEEDRIDWMCYKIYDDPRYYLQVAEANKLTTFRRLKKGNEMVFPPVEK